MAQGGHDIPLVDENVSSSQLRLDLPKSASLAEGEFVYLNFTNSPVNVVAGNLTQNFYQTTNVHNEASPPSQAEYSALIKIVNENTLEKTPDNILEYFMTEGLFLPDFQVNPRMRKVEAEDYFKGKYEDVDDMKITVRKRSLLCMKRKKVLKNQLRKETAFHRHEFHPENALTLDQVFMSIAGNSNSAHRIGIVASAGSGKTTLVRRLARKCLDVTAQTHDVSHEVGLKMIHFIELKTIQYASSVKPSKFLFGGLFKNEADEINAYHWLQNNQTEAILYFDGLDQTTWKIDHNKNYNKINPFSEADAATIMNNILSGNLLPKTRIVFSSREFIVSELPADARPSTIITLSGLTRDDAQKLFEILIREDGAEAWNKISIISPGLLNVLSVPVFLILTAILFKRDPKIPPPTTVTELYQRIIAALGGVENVRQRDKIREIVKKLKVMAYRGMKKGRVVFYQEDMRKFGVSIEETQDLIMKVPGSKLLNRHFLEGDFNFFFCHQSIQEFLAASFIAHMNTRKFSQFNEKHLHEKRWSVVRIFVSGLVYDKSEDNLPKVSNQARKQEILARSFRSILEKNDENCMELYTAIYETDDDDLIKNISLINASFVSLSRDEAHIVGSLTAKIESLDSLDLEYCSIDDDCMGIIARCLNDRIKVKEVDLRNNTFSATALRSLLGDGRIESLSGKVEWDIVWITAGGSYFNLKNEEDVIKICDNAEGYFDKKTSTLAVEQIPSLTTVIFCGRLFDAEHIKLNEQQHLFVKQDDLMQIKDVNLKRISKILLDCTEQQVIDWSLIETSLTMYQIVLLDIAVNGLASTDDLHEVLKRRRKIAVLGDVHVMFFIEKENDLRRIMEVCQLIKIDCIRCIFNVECDASLDELSAVIKDSNLKKLTLIYRDEADILTGKELSRVQKIANELGTELELLEFLGGSVDAWEQLEDGFVSRELRRNKKCNNTDPLQE